MTELSERADTLARMVQPDGTPLLPGLGKEWPTIKTWQGLEHKLGITGIVDLALLLEEMSVIGWHLFSGPCYDSMKDNWYCEFDNYSKTIRGEGSNPTEAAYASAVPAAHITLARIREAELH